MNAGNVPFSVYSHMIQDPIWLKCMQYRLQLSYNIDKICNLWRASLVLSLSEQLSSLNHGDEFDVAIEGDVVSFNLLFNCRYHLFSLSFRFNKVIKKFVKVLSINMI